MPASDNVAARPSQSLRPRQSRYRSTASMRPPLTAHTRRPSKQVIAILVKMWSGRWRGRPESARMGAVKELVYSRLFLPAADRGASAPGFICGDDRVTLGQHAEQTIRMASALREEL